MAADRINKFIESIINDNQLTVHKYTNRTIVKVLEREPGRVNRQIPPEEVIGIANLFDEPKALIMRKKVYIFPAWI